MLKTISLITLLFLPISVSSLAQQYANFSGTVVNEDDESLAGATIRDLTSGKVVASDANGSFHIQITPDMEVQLEISFIGYSRDTIWVHLQAGEEFKIVHRLIPEAEEIGEVIVENWINRPSALQRINKQTIENIPVLSGSIETFLSTMGAGIRNEMSPRYSVRGGNYDENLIYLNGVEIYRPMLVKAGQQEGLSLINPSLVSSIKFSSGGFEAQYGDKMSSVLDIQYRRPDRTAGSVLASFLGASAHLEGVLSDGRLRHITGIRYKSNQYLLNDLQTKGDYKPDFFDLQSYMTYDISDKLELSFLGNIALNRYRVTPHSRSTAFGTVQQTLNFTVYYEGEESDIFRTLSGAFSINLVPSERMIIKATGSVYSSSESVTYDILGRYRIDLLDNTVDSEASKDSILNLGYGGSLIHARNYLDARIGNLQLSASYTWKRSNLKMGVSIQSEKINDQISEWEMLDSAGYSIPYSGQSVALYSTIMADNEIASKRITGFIQNTFNYAAGQGNFYFNGGVRFHYWSISDQLIISPRARIMFDPSWNKLFSFYAAAGLYYQPPLYKELRNPEGLLHKEIKAQKSIHYVLGSEYDFRVWERPFKLTAELYYKQLDNLIPYYVDDVEINYLPQYLAKGYAVGIDIKINGEFVKDAESWASLSVMRTREDRYYDEYGDYPRPTDQLINFGMYFQDYLPNNPSYRLHLNMYYGSRIPYSSSSQDRPDRLFSLKAYKRIDIGISKSLTTDIHGNRNSRMRGLEDLLLSLEIFNLFDFQNQASYQWIRTIRNQDGVPNMFAVPSYLTGRLLNLKLSVKF